MKAKLLIGTSGWSYDYWIKRFYPDGLDRREWLRFYCERFNSVEVNMSFYRFPFANMLKGWYSKTPEDFVFTFKANRQITHERKFEGVKSLVKRFQSLVDLTKEKLGRVLWQLPPSMHYSEKNLDLLDWFMSGLEGKKNVFEFRHRSWWRPETYKLLRKYGAGFCVVSCPSLPEDTIFTGEVAYFRFHGKSAWYRHEYSEAELAEWAEQIKEATHSRLEVYCYFNNDFMAYAPKNAAELRKMLQS